MPSLDTIPAELVLIIFENVDRRDLRALRYVNSKVSWAATKLLFSRLYVGGLCSRMQDNLPYQNELRPLMRMLEFDGSDTTLYRDAKTDTRLRPRGVRKFLKNLGRFDDINIHTVQLRNGGLCLSPLLKCFAEYGIHSIRHVSILYTKAGEKLTPSVRKGDKDRDNGIDEKLLKLLSGLESFELATNFGREDELIWWMDKMPNLKKLHLTTCSRYLQGRFALWSFMNAVHLRPAFFARLRVFTLTIHTLLSCFLGSPLIHQSSVQEITLLYVDLLPKMLNPYHELNRVSEPKWDYCHWQDFIDAFQKEYKNGQKRLTIGMPEECRVPVRVHSRNRQVVRILCEHETRRLTGQC